MQLPEVVRRWPVLRQLRNDPLGLGPSVRSTRSERLRPRTERADHVVQSVCPYCAVGCGQLVYVFKVTSPMSVGSWLLFASAGASVTAAALERLGRLKRVKLAAEVVSAATGAPLATYTGGLVADTAIPVWHDARRELPYVFGASGAASAGAACTLFLDPGDAAPARRLAVAGAAAELGLVQAMERRLGPPVSEPYRQGTAGKLTRASRLCVAAGAGLLASGGRRSRHAAAVGGGLLLTGEALLRFAVWKAGAQSARDPRYTVTPQRERAAARSI